MSSGVLCTFPGKAGDILWALPTIREIARTFGERVDLMLSAPYAELAELLRACCPYLDRAWAEEQWQVRYTAPMCPRRPPEADPRHARIYHLGYDGWPDDRLLVHTYNRAVRIGALPALPDSRLIAPIFAPPWLTLPPIHQPTRGEVFFGFTDQWFELKLGLVELISAGVPSARFVQVARPGSRWAKEAGVPVLSMLDAAALLSSCGLYVGCLSFHWVLANALGVPAVGVEPDPNRHQEIFWWDGPEEQDGRARNRIVRGGDGKPSFDARHAVETVREELGRER